MLPRAFWAGIFGVWIAVAWAQSQPPENWTVSVAVTDSITGRPVPGAAILWEPSFAGFGFRDRPLLSPSANAGRAATDADGKFTLTLESGATGVHLFVSSAGYRAANGQQFEALLLRAPVPPETVRSASIQLVPQSVIRGRITNSSGARLGGMDVNATRVQIRDGLRQPVESFSKASEANGDFEFDNLPPGEYYLRAAGRAGGGASAYGPLYYPSASSRETAELLQVAPGKTVDAPMRLDGHAAYKIRGILVDLPLRRMVSIRLLRRDDPLDNPTEIGFNGTFEIDGVSPGEYTLQAYTPGIVPMSFGEAHVTVRNRDTVAGQVSMNEGVDVTGHVEFRGSGSLSKYAVLRATLFNPASLPGEVAPQTVVMRSNGDFVFRHMLPGRYEISVGGLPNTYLAAMRSDADGESSDALEQGVVVTAESSPRIEIVMQAGAAEVSGRIEGAAIGSMFDVALVMARGAADVPQIVRAPDGRFHADGLAPGDYTLLAWPESRTVEFRNPAVLEKLLPQGMKLSLSEGMRRNVSIAPLP